LSQERGPPGTGASRDELGPAFRAVVADDSSASTGGCGERRHSEHADEPERTDRVAGHVGAHASTKSFSAFVNSFDRPGTRFASSVNVSKSRFSPDLSTAAIRVAY